MSLSSKPRAYPVLAAALTNIHPGAGRSPGVVDLPVVRDPLGFFYIPGSSFKGAIKSTAALLKDCVEGDKINCDKDDRCKRLCCLLGGEVGEAVEAPSRLSIGDLYPLLIPVPSLSHGFLYATSPALIARARTIQEAMGTNGSLLDKLLNELEKEVMKLNDESIDAIILGAKNSYILIGTTELNVKSISNVNLNSVVEELSKISSIYKIHPLQGNTIVVSDKFMPLIIERALVRLTRVRLDRSKKTVAPGALWTEEYIPQFTLFAGYIADTVHNSSYCNNINDAIEGLLRSLNASNDSFAIVVGGKETVGKGLLRVKVIRNREEKKSR